MDSVRLELLRDVVERFGRARLRLTGTSMLPELWPGDEVEVVAADPGQLRPGDVVLIEREGRPFCHRLVRLDERDGELFLVTRGDSLDRNDPLVSSHALLGRVVQGPAKRRPLLVPDSLLACALRLSPRLAAWLVRRRLQ